MARFLFTAQLQPDTKMTPQVQSTIVQRLAERSSQTNFEEDSELILLGHWRAAERSLAEKKAAEDRQQQEEAAKEETRREVERVRFAHD